MNIPKHGFPNGRNWLPNGGKWTPKEMLLEWQTNDHRGVFPFFGVYFQSPSMPLIHNVIRQTQPQTCALSSRLGGEEGLEDFLADGFGDAVSIVLYFDDDLIVRFLRGNGDGGLICGML